MKHRLLMSVMLIAALPAVGEEICRSISTSWEADGHSYNTRMWTKADEAGCKIIEHTIDGEKVEGVDCDCDLIMDGLETRISQPDSERQRGRLTDICLGPIAEEPEVPMSRPGDAIIIDS